MVARTIATLETPVLLLDERRMRANIARMRQRVAHLGVDFRPHVKTAKCIEVARSMTGGANGAITVSTLREADKFAGMDSPTSSMP